MGRDCVPDEDGEVRMIQSYKQYPDQSIWFGENYFTFGGNQTLEIKADDQRRGVHRRHPTGG